jgi:ABC-type multidrug transport system fused ATPase/permease subunit
MHDFIINLPNQYKEKVGERGIKLSGGQRQRIGIARALYRGANVILFDEATNQLDTDTESLIVKSINNLGKEITIILIAHRLSTLENCDQIIDLSKKPSD